jgi:SAM-dependent methyltransferase
MPTSYTENIPAIVGAMERLKPMSCLDVGPGYGKFGFLFRERVDDFQWLRQLDACEVFGGYFDRSRADYLYNRVFQGAFPDAVPNGVRYDLILMIDVLEHYDDDAGERALSAALAMAPRVLISTPLGYAQGPSHGNVHETHRSEWPASRLRSFGRFIRYPAGTGDSVIGLLERP